MNTELTSKDIRPPDQNLKDDCIFNECSFQYFLLELHHLGEFWIFLLNPTGSLCSNQSSLWLNRKTRERWIGELFQDLSIEPNQHAQINFRIPEIPSCIKKNLKELSRCGYTQWLKYKLDLRAFILNSTKLIRWQVLWSWLEDKAVFRTALSGCKWVLEFSRVPMIPDQTW